MKSIVFTLLSLCGSIYLAHCPPKEIVSLISLAEQLKSKLTGQYWSEWEDTEMPLLLIDDQQEYVFNTKVHDSTFAIQCDKHPSRPASFNKNFLATFPLLNHQPTIVVGTPENTGKNEEAWTTTLLHEHFHQLQFSRPNYYQAQKALDLDHGDQSGMWMLNHPFPYDNNDVNVKFKKMALNLLQVDSIPLQKVFTQHKLLKSELKNMIGEEHYKYLNLQLWQEGYARYMEMQLTQDWIDQFHEINQDQFTKADIELLKNRQQQEVKTHLISNSPKELKRVYFYALGAAEAELISRVNIQWKQQYFDSLFTTDHLLIMKQE